MTQIPVLPFQLKRSKEEFGAASMTTTTERVHGLLRVEGEEVVIQWRTAWEVQRLDSGISTDEEIDEVREARIPLSAFGGAFVRKRWWEFWRRPRIVLLATDLEAFEAVTGEDGLRLKHPAELMLDVRFKDRLLAEEFSAELELAVAKLGIGSGDGVPRLEPKTGAEPPEDASD